MRCSNKENRKKDTGLYNNGMNKVQLFHVSEEPNIRQFEPRPSRFTEKPVVWAVAEARLHNYLLPRNCPRVTYYALPDSSPEDVARYLGSSQIVVAVEGKWLSALRECVLTLYHMPTTGFRVLDEGAGHWVCTNSVTPIATTTITNCLEELVSRQIEIRILPELWTLRDAILASTLQFSFIRMRNAQPRTIDD
jgi:hypothetical protein